MENKVNWYTTNGRRVFYVDVGNMPKEDVFQFIERFKNKVDQRKK